MGHESDVQITAFEDLWHWGEQTERENTEIQRPAKPKVRAFIF